mgnify:CR=1 FL=1
MELYELIYSYCSKNKELLKQYNHCTCLFAEHLLIMKR